MMIKKITGTRSYILLEFFDKFEKVKIDGELTLTPAFYAEFDSIRYVNVNSNEIQIGENEKLDIVAEILKFNNSYFKIIFEGQTGTHN